jgi:hypothetical protein
MASNKSPSSSSPEQSDRKVYNIRQSVLSEASTIIDVLEKKVQRRARTLNRFTLAGFELEEDADHAAHNPKENLYGAVERGGWLAYYANCIMVLGGTTTIKERGWIMYDVADSPISFAQTIYTLMLTLYLPRAPWFGVSIYVLVNIVSTLKSALTFCFYLSFSSSAEYGRLKTKFLWYAAHIGGITLIMSFFVFSPNWAIILLIFLDVFHKICYRICSVAYDALLFPVTNGEPARQHMIQSVAVIIGYLIMGFFAIFFIGMPMGVSYLLHGKLHTGTHEPTLDEDTFLNIMFLQFKLPLMFLGVWWIVFTRQSFWLMGKIPYGLPYPKGLNVTFNCCLYRRLHKSGNENNNDSWAKGKKKEENIEFIETSTKRARIGSDMSAQSDDGETEAVTIKNVEDIALSQNDGKDEGNTVAVIEDSEGQEENGSLASDKATNEKEVNDKTYISKHDIQSIKDKVNERRNKLRKSSSRSITRPMDIDLTLKGYSKCQICKFAFLQGMVEIGRTFVTLKRENMHDLYKFLICVCFITDATSMISTIIIVIVTKSWDWATTWIVIGGTCAVIVAVTTLMTVRMLIKRKRLKTFNAMRISTVAMLVALVWLILIDMPPVEYKNDENVAMAAANDTSTFTTMAPSERERVSWSKDRVASHIHTIFVLCIYATGYIVFNTFIKSSICSLTPEYLQSSVFAIAEMTQKGTSIIGPLITISLLQGVEEKYHEKITVGVAAFMILLGTPLFYFVNEKRGNLCAEHIDKLRLTHLKREASIALGLSIKRLSQGETRGESHDTNKIGGTPPGIGKEEQHSSSTTI